MYTGAGVNPTAKPVRLAMLGGVARRLHTPVKLVSEFSPCR